MRPRRNTEHGMYGFARREKCDCEPCHTAVRKYHKRRKYDSDRGMPRTVDTAEVRAHLQQLLDQGVSYRQIAKAAGVSTQQVKTVVCGRDGQAPAKRIYRRTAEKMLTVTVEAARGAGYTCIDPTGTRRRLEALRWLGYSPPEIAARLDCGTGFVFNPTRLGTVRTDTAEAVKAVYDELSMTPGTSTRERLNAWRNGWLPPMAWEDTDIDNPDVEPDLSMVVCVVDRCTRCAFKLSVCARHYRMLKEAGALTDARKYSYLVQYVFPRRLMQNFDGLREELRELHEQGYTMSGAALRLGRSESYIEKIWSQVA